MDHNTQEKPKDHSTQKNLEYLLFNMHVCTRTFAHLHIHTDGMCVCRPQILAFFKHGKIMLLTNSPEYVTEVIEFKGENHRGTI